MYSSEADEIVDDLLGKSRDVLILVEKANIIGSEEHVRKSRRKSSSFLSTDKIIEQSWIAARVLRIATVPEKSLGFSHLVELENDGTMLVNLSLQGYFDMEANQALKPNKLALRQDTWIALKEV